MCFYDIAMIFSQSLPNKPTITTNLDTAADGTTLIFGAHLLPTFKATITGGNYIIYQTEQLGAADSVFSNPDYIEILKAHPVWDYSQLNIAYLATHGISAKYVPIGYNRCMSNIKTGKSVSYNPKTLNIDFAEWSGHYPAVDHNGKYIQDIDICFYGSVNERRMKIFEELKAKTLPVTDPVTKEVIQRPLVVASFIGYSGFRDKLIARSKIVLNMHYYDTAIFEIFRCSHLFSNRKCVVSEVGKDVTIEEPFYPTGGFSDYEHLVELCMVLLNDEEARIECAAKGYEIFTRISQKEILEGIL